MSVLSSMAKFVTSSAHSCSELEEAARFQVATGFLEALSQLHQQLRLIPTQGLRFLPDFKLSTLWRRHSSLIWSFGKIKAQSCERDWFSHSGHWLTPACLPFLQHWWLIWTALLHERPINWQDWKDIELGQVFALPAWQDLFNPSHILARNWNRQRDSW